MGDVVYPIYELPTADLPNLHDGTLDDWDAVLPFTSLTHNDFVGLDSSDPPDPGDLAWRVFLAWHHASQRLYFAVERFDDDYTPPDVGPIGEGATNLYVDGDHSGGKFADFNEAGRFDDDNRKLLEHAQAQWYWIKPEPPPGGDNLLRVGNWGAWVLELPWAEAGGFVASGLPHLSTTEAFITVWDNLDWRGPEHSRPSRLEPNRFIGFLLTVWDMDRGGDEGTRFTLAKSVSIAGGQWADNFVDGELVPCNVGDCSRAGSITAVRHDSWGRIKASLRDDETD